MTEQEALSRMIAPGTRRPNKPAGGVIQILVTSSCDKACVNCTQASNLRRRLWFMTPEQFGQAVESLRDYWGVVGLFGGNPAVSPHFLDYCRILRVSGIPKERCGIWCNNPLDVLNARAMRTAFNPAVSNLNVHLDRKAYDLFRAGWPEARPFGLDRDSRHSPPWVAMRDVLRKECPSCGGDGLSAEGGRFGEKCVLCGGAGQVYDEGRAWELIAGCDINQHWSAGIAPFRGELRAWFCEIAMAQSVLRQDEVDYPDTGIDPTFSRNHPGLGQHRKWWQLPMTAFAHQARKHCHECSIPLNGYGELAQSADGTEQVSATHAAVYRPKKPGRRVEVVTRLEQLGVGKIQRATDYLQNAGR